MLPDADVKVYLTASVEERARRRADQLGRDDLDVLAEQIARRDAADGGRAVAPMLRADDAWELDTTGWALDDVVDVVVERIHEVVAGVEHDHLDVPAAAADPVAARVGGMDAVMIDVALAPGGEHCGIGMIIISRWIHELWDRGLRLRLYLVDLPKGMSVETLAITVVAPEERFEEFIEETAPILDSIEFHGQ